MLYFHNTSDEIKNTYLCSKKLSASEELRPRSLTSNPVRVKHGPVFACRTQAVGDQGVMSCPWENPSKDGGTRHWAVRVSDWVRLSHYCIATEQPWTIMSTAAYGPTWLRTPPLKFSAGIYGTAGSWLGQVSLVLPRQRRSKSLCTAGDDVRRIHQQQQQQQQDLTSTQLLAFAEW